MANPYLTMSDDPLRYKPDRIARNPSTISVLRHFFHQKPAGGQVAMAVCDETTILAVRMADSLPEGPDLTLALRDLLAARDGFLRALVE